MGLFVDAPAEQVRAVLDAVPLQLLQFHGAEPPEYCASFPLPYIKAVRVSAGSGFATIRRAVIVAAKGLLLDAFVDGSHGGTGVSFDWALIPARLAAADRAGRRAHAGQRGRGRPPRAALGGGREQRRRARKRHQGRGHDRRLHPRSARCRCMRPGRSTICPTPSGHFGPYGGVFVAETLMHALDELKREYLRVREDAAFQAEFEYELKHYVGRPSPVYHAKRLSEQLGGAQIWLKREDLNHTGAHKINNTVGQALVARRMGKKRVIAETGAGQHGVAAATVAARYGMECVVYMGSEDIKRQAMNVYRMKLLGATVVPVESGSKTLKDALNEAMRDWVTNVETTFYIIGTVAGPHPYPMMVRDFNSVVGRELRTQMPEVIGRQPDAILACVGGGSATPWACSIPISRTPTVQLIGVEAAGEGIATGHHAATLCAGRPGRAARQSHLSAAGRGRPDHRDAFDFRRAGLSRGRARALVAQGQRPRASTSPPPMRRRSMPSTRCAASKASCRRSNRATRWPTP